MKIDEFMKKEEKIKEIIDEAIDLKNSAGIIYENMENYKQAAEKLKKAINLKYII